MANSGDEGSNASWPSWSVGNDPSIPGIKTNSVTTFQGGGFSSSNGSDASITDEKKSPWRWIFGGLLLVVAVCRLAVGHSDERSTAWFLGPNFTSIVGLLLGFELSLVMIVSIYMPTKQRSESRNTNRLQFWCCEIVRWALMLPSCAMLTYIVASSYYLVAGSNGMQNMFEGTYLFGIPVSTRGQDAATVSSAGKHFAEALWLIMVSLPVCWFVRAFYVASRS